MTMTHVARAVGAIVLCHLGGGLMLFAAGRTEAVRADCQRLTFKQCLLWGYIGLLGWLLDVLREGVGDLPDRTAKGDGDNDQGV